MKRIEDEAARMGVLVEDLLTLARLDEIADAPHVDVDVGALARDAVDDARATAPDREIEPSRPNGPALVSRRRAPAAPGARQPRAQRARAHARRARRSRSARRREDGRVRLEVRDHGPGLPGEPTRRSVFERFWRAEGGRERGKDGAGLGLAIVAGIVDAHGGTVAARNAAGGGAASP